MKVLLLFSFIATNLFGISYGNPIEFDESYNRFALIPNAEGQMHLIDLEAPQDQDPEPFFVPENDIRFMLFTRNNPDVGQRLIFRDLESVRNSNYNAAHPTRFTIHG
jgi:pancreatic triacylglycerol lipase